MPAYLFGHKVAFSEVVNTCLEVTENPRAESWDKLDPSDIDKLENAVEGIVQGLLLWLPLRHDEVLPAPKLYFTDYTPRNTAKDGRPISSSETCQIRKGFRPALIRTRPLF